MKFKYLLYSFFIGTSLAFVSCEDFLNKLPDNRTQLDSDEKITSLLVAAYSEGSPAIMAELSGDNFIDNGKFLGARERQHDEIFAWQPSTANSQDSPSFYWNACYKAAATANNVLEAIEQLGNPDRLKLQKGEALLCRAYAHFQLVSIFCLAYDPRTAAQDQGLPYSTSSEKIVKPDYERGTLKQTYEKIEKDLEAGLLLVGDNLHKVSKYHFGIKSAHAFAARFYLYTRKFDKVVEHANVVLGPNPESLLRDFNSYEMSEYEYAGNKYVRADNACNLLITTASSGFARVFGTRYGHAGEASAGCLQGEGPNWSSQPTFVTGYTYYIRNIEWGVVYPKQIEFFEYTDKVAGIGFVHIVHTPFTADETLLCRAEAYAHLNRLDEAVVDLGRWTKSHKIGNTLTMALIKRFYVPQNTLFVKEFNTDMQFTEDQKAVIDCALHFRRIETVYDGLRWNDIKRYGIEVTHVFDKKASATLKYNDPRRAIQIPADVESAGLVPNKRQDGAGSSSSFIRVK